MPESALTFVSDLLARAPITADAAVAKVVLKAEGARVVVFAFDDGAALSEHSAAMPILLQLLDGRVRLTVEDESVELAPGDLAHVRARAVHSVIATEPSRMMLTMLDPRVKS